MAIQLPPLLAFIVTIVVFVGAFLILNVLAWIGFISTTLQPIVDAVAVILIGIGGMLGIALVKTRKLHDIE